MRDAGRMRNGPGKGGDEWSRRTARPAPPPRPQPTPRSERRPRGPGARRPARTARTGPHEPPGDSAKRNRPARNRFRLRGEQRAGPAGGMGSRGDGSEGGLHPAERPAPARPPAPQGPRAAPQSETASWEPEACERSRPHFTCEAAQRPGLRAPATLRRQKVGKVQAASSGQAGRLDRLTFPIFCPSDDCAEISGRTGGWAA